MGTFRGFAADDSPSETRNDSFIQRPVRPRSDASETSSAPVSQPGYSRVADSSTSQPTSRSTRQYNTFTPSSSVSVSKPSSTAGVNTSEKKKNKKERLENVFYGIGLGLFILVLIGYLCLGEPFGVSFGIALACGGPVIAVWEGIIKPFFA